MNAVASTYMDWLKWYTGQGGKVTHSYDYLVGNNEPMIAASGSRFYGGYGANSIFVIVPRHVDPKSVIIDNRTFHDKVFAYDMELMKDVSWIPQYRDCVVDPRHYQESMLESMAFENKSKQEMDNDDAERRKWMRKYNGGDMQNNERFMRMYGKCI